MIAATSTRPNESKRGFTLTEIAIVLGIIGLILGAIWAAASSVYSNQKSNNAQRGILATAQAVRSLYGASATTGQPSGTLNVPGVFPTDWQTTNGTAGNPVFGNPWHLNPTTGFAYIVAQNQIFAIDLEGMPDSGCASLVGFYASSTAGSLGGSVPGLVGSSVGTGTGGAPTAAIPTLTPGAQADPGNFATPASCQGGTQNQYSVAIVFDMSQM